MNKKHIYMIGIGGISMGGIAKILVNYGYKVSGSDITENDEVKELEKLGIKVNIGQVKENITDDIDLVVYTAAISNTNEELVRARELNIETIERGVFLGGQGVIHIQKQSFDSQLPKQSRGQPFKAL